MAPYTTCQDRPYVAPRKRPSTKYRDRLLHHSRLRPVNGAVELFRLALGDQAGRPAFHDGRRPDGVDMGIGRLGRIPGVASGQQNHEGDFPQKSPLHDDPVAAQQPGFRHGQAAQLIAGQRISPGQVENDVRREFLVDLREVAPHRFQIGPVSVSRPQPDIQGPGHFFRRVDVHLMDGERENVLPLFEDRGRPVALVDVAVDDHHPADPALPLELLNGDRRVVEKAESLAVVGESMMESSAEMDAKPVVERPLGRQNRAADVQPEKGDQLGGKRQFQRLDLVLRQASGLKLAEIFRRMNELKILEGSRLGLEEVFPSGAQGGEPLMDHPVFPHREDMFPGIQHPVFLVVHELEGKTAAEKNFKKAHGGRQSIS